MSEYRTKAATITVDGVTFEAWHTDILRYERRSTDGRAVVRDNGHHRSTYSASVDGEIIGRNFRSQRTAMQAAARLFNPRALASLKSP